MASYKILIKASAAKELERLPEKPRRQIVKQVQALSEQPGPSGCEKLTGEELYRIRQGYYRVIYAIEDAVRTGLVMRVAHRREVYR